jgi:hypothetical protein
MAEEVKKDNSEIAFKNSVIEKLSALQSDTERLKDAYGKRAKQAKRSSSTSIKGLQGLKGLQTI